MQSFFDKVLGEIDAKKAKPASNLTWAEAKEKMRQGYRVRNTSFPGASFTKGKGEDGGYFMYRYDGRVHDYRTYDATISGTPWAMSSNWEVVPE